MEGEHFYVQSAAFLLLAFLLYLLIASRFDIDFGRLLRRFRS